MENNRNNALIPIASLRDNASAYFERLHVKNRRHMACGAGCSKCCEVESLTVGESEAMLILEWFANLSELDRKILTKKWETQGHDSTSACCFLKEKKCSVYQARPIICRTQGAPLKFKLNDDEIGVDACPLNFTEFNRFPGEDEWLDLDRLNTLLAIAENSYLKETTARPLKRLLNEDSRVALSDLQQFLKSWT